MQNENDSKKYIEFINDWKGCVNHDIEVDEIIKKYTESDFLYARTILEKNEKIEKLIRNYNYDGLEEIFKTSHMKTFFTSSREIIQNLKRMQPSYGFKMNILIEKIIIHFVNAIKEKFYDIKIEIIEKDPSKKN